MSVAAESKTYFNFINGRWVKAESGGMEQSLNPADTRDIVGLVQKSSIEDVDRAVEAAKQAKKAWRKLSGAERGQFLYKAADIMEQRLDEIAECATREMGKTLPEAKGETARGIAILRYYAGEGLRKTGDVIPSTDSSALCTQTGCRSASSASSHRGISLLPSRFGKWRLLLFMEIRLSLSRLRKPQSPALRLYRALKKQGFPQAWSMR